MCQPLAISACTTMGTVRPVVTLRVSFPPTTVQRTGRNDARSAGANNGKSTAVSVRALAGGRVSAAEVRGKSRK
jgi:hypothetical protein